MDTHWFWFLLSCCTVRNRINLCFFYVGSVDYVVQQVNYIAYKHKCLELKSKHYDNTCLYMVKTSFVIRMQLFGWKKLCLIRRMQEVRYPRLFGDDRDFRAYMVGSSFVWSEVNKVSWLELCLAGLKKQNECLFLSCQKISFFPSCPGVDLDMCFSWLLLKDRVLVQSYGFKYLNFCEQASFGRRLVGRRNRMRHLWLKEIERYENSHECFVIIIFSTLNQLDPCSVKVDVCFFFFIFFLLICIR